MKWENTQGYLKRAAFILYSAVILGLALPVAAVAHIIRFGMDLEETWVMWLADWSKRNHKHIP